MEVDRCFLNYYRMYFNRKVILALLLTFPLTLSAHPKSLTADFVQTKHMKMIKGEEMVAHGHMACQAPSLLRWEYFKPYSFAFVMNGGRAKIVKNSTKMQEFKGPEAKMFKDLGKVMMTILEQTSRRGKRIGPTIFPVPKDMRHLYNKITLYHNKQTGVIEKVVMQEIEGDYTVIEFKNVKTNIKIDKGIFK